MMAVQSVHGSTQQDCTLSSDENGWCAGRILEHSAAHGCLRCKHAWTAGLSFYSRDEMVNCEVRLYTHGPFEVRLPGRIRPQEKPVYLSLTCLRGEGESHYTLIDKSPLRTIDRDVQTIRDWYSECLAHHGHEDVSLEAPELPTRVIDVGSDDTQPRLHSSKGQKAVYVSLSHRWGAQDDKTNHRLLTSNIAAMSRAIHLADLPRLFRQVIELTRTLGVKYLWIDALCIIQDDVDDWAREASCMADIYANASFVLAAAAAEDHHGALHSIDNFIPNKAVRSMEIQETNSESPRTAFVAKSASMGAAHAWCAGWNPLGTLEKRGWILQEELLASRIVFFHSNELYWRCGARSCCECGATKLPSMTKAMDAGSKQALVRGVRRNVMNEDNSVHDLKRHFSLWQDIVKQFTESRLTYESDRLPAVSGIASLFGPADDYLAGFWRDHFPECLFWSSTDKEVLERNPGPSWSWASYKGPTSWVRELIDSRLRRSIHLISCNVVRKGRNSYGSVSSGEIVLEGPVLRQDGKDVNYTRLSGVLSGSSRSVMVCLNRSWQSMNSLDEAENLIYKFNMTLAMAVKDYARLHPEEWIILFLPITERKQKVYCLGLVLQPSERIPNAYERIGTTDRFELPANFAECTFVSRKRLTLV